MNPKPNSKQAASSRHWVLAYDISRDRLRQRLAALLEGHAVRIQRSVFTTVCTQHEAVALLRKAQAFMEEGDKLLAWPVVSHSGVPQPWKARQKQSQVPDYWVV